MSDRKRGLSSKPTEPPKKESFKDNYGYLLQAISLHISEATPRFLTALHSKQYLRQRSYQDFL